MLKTLNDSEAAGSYLFHGSANGNITEFEPRQAMSFGKPDGEPAVFASDKLPPAVFMAVLGSRKLGGMGKPDGTEFGFNIKKSDWDRAQSEA